MAMESNYGDFVKSVILIKNPCNILEIFLGTGTLQVEHMNLAHILSHDTHTHTQTVNNEQNGFVRHYHKRSPDNDQ